MKSLLASALGGSTMLLATVALADDGKTGSLAFRPTAGIAVPIYGTTPIESTAGAGAHASAVVGWRFPSAFELMGGFAYTRHFPADLAEEFGNARRLDDLRGSGLGIFDAVANGRYWFDGWFYVDVVVGFTATSVVRNRDLNTTQRREATVIRDYPADSGFVTGAGAGVAVLRLTDGPRSATAPMVIVGVDTRLRLLGNGTLVTLPLTVGLTF